MLCTIVERIMPVGFYGSDMRAMNIEVRSPGLLSRCGEGGGDDARIRSGVVCTSPADGRRRVHAKTA